MDNETVATEINVIGSIYIAAACCSYPPLGPCEQTIQTALCVYLFLYRHLFTIEASLLRLYGYH